VAVVEPATATAASTKHDALSLSIHFGDESMSIPRRNSMVVSVFVGLSLALGAARTARAGGDDDKTKETKLEGDLKKIQGEWVSKDDMGESTWTFKGDRLSIKTTDRAYEITITLDAKAKPEKHMDFTVLEDSPNAKGTKAEGIYKLTDDGKLLICFAPAEGNRPTEFKTDFGTSFSFELKKKEGK
jgi:uncharacterized protein (TIGR03067 family)